ncbi:Nucleotide-binding universal stress protein, UspA family [Maribacter sedimenticola]|uniref:Nucleotide-binding universal stress protein, UspA family n=1 Tax=Maribacter sedimenticola TaxID=228956 RepID=A0ABY1SFA6_9FLAO|nr:universal stress protein [Maribacter sedimenticola]SNR40683.1 Nucleotide-binding universal stress protein, UspA family [Maribacter sedimenticola]
MKKILVTTDFSENSWNSIFTALKVYAQTQCHFYILHAYEPSALNVMGSKTQQRLGVIYDSLKKYSEKELEEMFSYFQINHKNPLHEISTISKAGALTDAVANIIAKNDIDLLIMGTQGATGAKEVFLGSNTVKVLKSITHTPILAVPAGFNFQRLKTVLFATDFAEPFKKNELEPLIELAKLWQAGIEIVHVAVEFILSDTQQMNKEKLIERLKDIDLSFNNIPFEVNVSTSINKYIADDTASILGIIRHQHTFWEKVIGEAVVHKLAFHANIPVLFLPQ